MEMTRKVQERMQKDVQTLLDEALGEGRAFVRVNVELDFDQRQTDRQTFTPVVEDSGIIRSQQEMSESYTGTSQNPGGPAGVQSNVPGYVAQTENANAQYEKKESTRNYEINEEKQKIIASPGSIRRVNIAVLVNDDITRTQQDSILRSVSSAVGINPERGDTVSVEPLPFNTAEADRKAAEEMAAKARRNRVVYIQLAVVVLVLALAAGALLMQRRRRRLELEAMEEERLAQEALEAQRREAEKRMEDERADLVAAGLLQEEELTLEEKRHLSEREAIEKLIREKPAEVAMLVKTWLSEE